MGHNLAFRKIIIDPELCTTMLLEKLRKSDRSLEDCCLCLQHVFNDQPRVLWVSGETRWAARHSQAYHSKAPSVLIMALISLLLQRLHKLY